LRHGVSRAVVNSHETITGDFTRNPDLLFPGGSLRLGIAAATGAENSEFIEATRIATGLLGDSIATNLFLLGYAYQRGLVPVSAEAIERAIELNAVAVAFNRAAFRWGRRAAVDLTLVTQRATSQSAGDDHRIDETLDEVIARRIDFLTQYQNAAYASRYAQHVQTIRDLESARVSGSTALTDVVARALFKLMAYKDEYEVARLYTDTGFLSRVAEQFQGDWKLRFHLAPPLFAERDPDTGHLKKSDYGSWMMGAFRLLARLRFLRGTAFDPFGRTDERRRERRLIADYEALLGEIAARLDDANHATAVELAAAPLEIRGFGHVKEANIARATAKQARLLEQFRNPAPAPAVAAE
jgi:indolepyruvate ferredoxin oxidoreductase